MEEHVLRFEPFAHAAYVHSTMPTANDITTAVCTIIITFCKIFTFISTLPGAATATRRAVLYGVVLVW